MENSENGKQGNTQDNICLECLEAIIKYMPYRAIDPYKSRFYAGEDENMSKENVQDFNEFKAKKEIQDNINSVHIPGIRNGYVYGRLFKSSFSQGQVVIDIGKKECPIDEAEIWNGVEFVLTDNLNNKDDFYGETARVNLKSIDESNWISKY